MHVYFRASCWAAMILGVAVAGALDLIDEISATTLLITLPVAGWMAVSGRGCCPAGRRA